LRDTASCNPVLFMGSDGADGLRPVSVSIDAEALENARNGFHRAFPRRSAKRVLHITQGLALTVLFAGAAWALANAAALTLTILHVTASTLFACAIVWRLIAASSLAPHHVASRLASALADLHRAVPTLPRSQCGARFDRGIVAPRLPRLPAPLTPPSGVASV
jgi:hypothetical protein